MRLLASLAFEGFGAGVLPGHRRARRWLDGPWRRVAVDGLTPRSVGLARRRRGRLSAPARAVRDAVRDLVAATEQPGVHPTVALVDRG